MLDKPVVRTDFFFQVKFSECSSLVNTPVARVVPQANRKEHLCLHANKEIPKSYVPQSVLFGKALCDDSLLPSSYNPPQQAYAIFCSPTRRIIE